MAPRDAESRVSRGGAAAAVGPAGGGPGGAADAHAGPSRAVLERVVGVERAREVSAYEQLTLEEKVEAMNVLLELWREPGLVPVPPALVIPDTTNREHTGLSGNHVHYIAHKMQTEGFMARDHERGTGHDLPIVVRESRESAFGVESFGKWGKALMRNRDLPRTALGTAAAATVIHDDGTRAGALRHSEAAALAAPHEFFCSLGNGHFFQSLNLFHTEHPCKHSLTGYSRYTTDGDTDLHAAVHRGVPSLVLRQGMSKVDRKFVSVMLNSSFEYRWRSRPDGSVRVDLSEEFRQFGSFDGLAKHADAYELDEIIDQKMKLEERAARDERQRKVAALEQKLRDKQRNSRL
jgi:hypothetical protein